MIIFTRYKLYHSLILAIKEIIGIKIIKINFILILYITMFFMA